MNIEESKVNAYLKRITPPACPLCGQKNWSVSTQVFQAPEYHRDTLIANGATPPMIPLVCVNCGNTYFINAIVAKLIEPQKKRDDGKPEDGGGDENG